MQKSKKISEKPVQASAEQALATGAINMTNFHGVGIVNDSGIASNGNSQNLSADQEKRNLALIRKAIERHKKYPQKAQKLQIQGICTIEFLLLASGEVRDIRILQSSGKALLDAAALQALKDASGEFPKISQDRRMSFELKFTSK